MVSQVLLADQNAAVAEGGRHVEGDQARAGQAVQGGEAEQGDRVVGVVFPVGSGVVRPAGGSMVEPQAVELAAGSLEAPGRNVEAGKAAQIARAEATFAGQGMAGGRMQGHGIAPERVKGQVGPSGRGWQVVGGIAEPGIDHPLPEQLDRPLHADMVVAAADPALRQGMGEQGAGQGAGLQPQGPMAEQPSLLVQFALHQQQG